MRILRATAALAAALAAVAPSASRAQHFHGTDPAPVILHPDSVPLWPGLRDHVSHRITTSNPRTQDYFNQGLALIYGFNHLEAVLSFQKAYQLDPGCAMCYWGKAVALGPNINQAMDTTRWRQAAGAIDSAWARRGNASRQEQAYILAARARYLPLPDFRRTPADEVARIRSRMDSAYAAAMSVLWNANTTTPDLTAGTIAAEALMDLRPWKQWGRYGDMEPGTQAVITTLKGVLRHDSLHVGAAHLWIHALEGSQNPGDAVWAADLLASREPGAGHIVHMPSHIYHRVGRYRDGVEHNTRAVAIDSTYLNFRGIAGRYPMYWAHNHDFLWVSANFWGNREKAMGAARALDRLTRGDDLLPRFYNAQHFLTAPILVHVRFGEWDQALADTAPRPAYAYARGIWNYGQGMARLRKGDSVAARSHLAALRDIARGPQADSLIMSNPVRQLLGIAGGILDGEILAAEGNYGPAIAALKGAVELQDTLRYDEPPPFPYAARHSLGAVLLAAGYPYEAEKVYLCDLAWRIDLCEPRLGRRGPLPQQVNVDNPWSLMGMAKVMQATGRDPSYFEYLFQQRWGGAPRPPGSRW